MATVLQTDALTEAEYMALTNEQLAEIDRMLAEIQEGHKRRERIQAETKEIGARIDVILQRIDDRMPVIEKMVRELCSNK